MNKNPMIEEVLASWPPRFRYLFYLSLPILWMPRPVRNAILSALGFAFTYLMGFDMGRAYRLKSLVWRAYDKGRYPQAAKLAQEWLALVGRLKRNDRFIQAEATHEAHQILGLICLREGRPEEADAHLLASGNTSGNCTLNSYGRRLKLARALVEAGRTEVVLEYLDLFAQFWAVKTPQFAAMERERKILIKQWKSQVRRGQIPVHKLWQAGDAPSRGLRRFWWKR